MKKYLIILVILSSIIYLTLIRDSHTVEPHDQMCSKCHQITKDEVPNILKELIPDAKVLEIQHSPVKGIWDIAIETRGKKAIVYIDFSKKYIVTGSIHEIKTKANLTQERFVEINKIDISQIPLDDALVMGEKNAKHRVIVFDDPD